VALIKINGKLADDPFDHATIIANAQSELGRMSASIAVLKAEIADCEKRIRESRALLARLSDQSTARWL